MKKKIWIIILVITILAVGIGWLVYALDWNNRFDEELLPSMEKFNSYNGVVWYYGDYDLNIELAPNYQKVTEFTEETIGDEDNQYAYHAIVIFDFDGKMNISDEELRLIKDYCENRYYDMLYYGTAHMEQFRKCGYFQTEMDDSERGFAYNGSYWMNRTGKEEYLNPYLLMGNWVESHEENFGIKNKSFVWKCAISYILIMIRESNVDI